MMQTRCKKFTLLEIVITMMMIVLITGIVISQIQSQPSFVDLYQIENQLKQICADARLMASCQGKKVEVWLDPEKRSIFVRDSSMTLPEGFKFIVQHRNLMDETEKQILFLFYPEGSAEEKVIILKLREEETELFLSPLTGKLYRHDKAPI